MRVTVRGIIHATSDVFGIPVDVLKGQRRFRDIVAARQCIYVLARDMTERSYPEIGDIVGGRDHSTVIHGRREGIKWMRVDAEFRAKVRTVRILALLRRGNPFYMPPKLVPEPEPEPEPEPNNLPDHYADDDFDEIDDLSARVAAYYGVAA